MAHEYSIGCCHTLNHDYSGVRPGAHGRLRQRRVRTAVGRIGEAGITAG
jgi:hypothetical protein